MSYRNNRPPQRASEREVPPEPARPAKAPVDSARHDHATGSKRRRWPFIVVGIVAILAIAGWFAWTALKGTGIDSGKYQAVFFTNGQVYFGKLQPFGNEQMKLKDVFYLRAQTEQTSDSENPQATTADQDDMQLIKLGSEIHGPEDAMVISKEQILFFENLKSDGKVSQSIKQYKSTN